MNLLLIDDDPEESEIFLYCLKNIKETATLRHLLNCEQALATNDFHPDIIFVDVNMPRIPGISCITKLKAHPHFRDTPIVIYTTSDLGSDIDGAYANGAVLYIRKASDIKGLMILLRKVFNLHENSRLIQPAMEDFVLSADE